MGNMKEVVADKTSLAQFDWTVKELGELGTFSKGKGILKEQVSATGLPCIRY